MDSLIKQAKRNCLRCSSYKTFKPENDLKEKCLTATKELYAAFLDEFNSLRRHDAPVGLIRKAQENKTVCLDAIGLCETCDQEFDKVNRVLQKICLPVESDSEQ